MLDLWHRAQPDFPPRDRRRGITGARGTARLQRTTGGSIAHTWRSSTQAGQRWGPGLPGACGPCMAPRRGWFL